MENQNIPTGGTTPPISAQPTTSGTVPPITPQIPPQSTTPQAQPQVQMQNPAPQVSPQNTTAQAQTVTPQMPLQNITPQAQPQVQTQNPAPQAPLQNTAPQPQPQMQAQIPAPQAPPQPQLQAQNPTPQVPPQNTAPQANITPRQLVAQPIHAQETIPQTPPAQPEGKLDIPQRHSSKQAVGAEEKPPKKKRKKLRLFPIFLFLLLIGFAAFVLQLYKGAKQEIADRENDIKELEAQLDDETARADAADADLEEYIEKVKSYGAADSVNLTFMRHMFPDMVVLPAEGGFAYYPINKDLKMAEYDYSALKTSSSGVKSYVPDNIRASYAGIDVSTFQGDIAWKKVAADDIDYAIIRLGYRGYGNGALVLDDKYKKNIKSASKNGLDVGVYFFTQAINAEEAKEEAEFVIKNLKGYKVNYPVVIDTEMIESGKSRGNALSPEERTETIKVFCDTIKAAGYTPMIYANLTWFITALDISQLEDYEKWFAGYETEPSYPYAFSMWQYTSSGTVKGIKGAVDRNISFVNYAEK